MNTPRCAIPILLVLSLVAGIKGSAEEQAPPNLLEIQVLSRNAAQIEFDVTLMPGSTGTLGLILPDRVQTLKGEKPPAASLSIAAGEKPRTEHYRYVIDASSPEKLLVKATLRTPEGKVRASVKQVIQIRENNNLARETAARRVPVVMTTPDGKKRIEYMTEAEASRRKIGSRRRFAAGWHRSAPGRQAW